MQDLLRLNNRQIK